MREGWEIRRLGDVCDLYQPKTISTDMLVSNGKYLVYGANGIIGRYNEYNHEQPEVLMTCRGATCGSINISKPFSWINGNAMVVHPKHNNLGQSFLKYLLQGIDLSCVITGAAQPQITRQSLKPVKVVVPPITEQERIVAELDCLTDIIEKKKQQLEELDKLAQSIFYDMFGDPITNEKGWEVKRLKDVAEIVGGSTPKTNVEKYWNGQNPWVAPAELHQNHYISSTERGISNEAAKGLTLLPVGTVLLSSRAPIGKVSITTIPMYCNQGFKNVVCSNALNNEYVYHLLLNKTEYLNSLGTGATFKEISKKTTENIAIAVPPIELQEAFAAQSRAIEAQKELVKRSIMETETLFNSRMDFWFNN